MFHFQIKLLLIFIEIMIIQLKLLVLILIGWIILSLISIAWIIVAFNRHLCIELNVHFRFHFHLLIVFCGLVRLLMASIFWIHFPASVIFDEPLAAFLSYYTGTVSVWVVIEAEGLNRLISLLAFLYCLS